MPATPFHIFPATTVYLLIYRYLHSFAFFLATFLIDVEPILYMIFNVPQPRVPLLFGGYCPSQTPRIGQTVMVEDFPRGRMD